MLQVNTDSPVHGSPQHSYHGNLSLPVSPQTPGLPPGCQQPPPPGLLFSFLITRPQFLPFGPMPCLNLSHFFILSNSDLALFFQTIFGTYIVRLKILNKKLSKKTSYSERNSDFRFWNKIFSLSYYLYILDNQITLKNFTFVQR